MEDLGAIFDSELILKEYINTITKSVNKMLEFLFCICKNFSSEASLNKLYFSFDSFQIGVCFPNLVSEGKVVKVWND